ncbi:acyltransferase family protein [Qaidamihabitans albus]|uniref:acyltransferase family protein n=1 Tax=Qaidamihabitans albus TaxID=2795733 RepID=UPI0027DBFAA1|nr:acyltransferase [Qaidamihabitans albus]
MIRVIAILFVVAGHVTSLGPSIPGIDGYPFEVSIPFGTVTLLVVSGYFVCPTIRRGTVTRWLRGRFARILPAYLVALLFTYVVTRYFVVGFNGWEHRPGMFGLLFAAPLAPAEPDPAALPPWNVPDARDLLANMFLVQEWAPDVLHRVDGSYWTIPVQMAAFVGAALLWRSRLRHVVGAQAVLWGVLAVSAVSPVLSLLIRTLPAASGLFYAHLFAAGAAIWLWSRHRLASSQLIAMLAVTVVLHAFRSGPPKLWSVVGFTIMLGLICAAARGPDWDKPVLSTLRRPISWLAGLSFGLYLVHQQLGYVIARLLTQAGVSSGWLRLAVVLGTVLAGAWLLTVLVERPAYRVLTRPRPGSGHHGSPAATVPGPPSVFVRGAT